MRTLLALLALTTSVFAQTVTDPRQAALVCAYNSAGAPTPAPGQYYFVQCDSLGRLLTTGGGGGGGSISLPQTISGGVSGGIPYFSNTTTMAASALLAANSLVIGGGAGLPPSTTTTGTGVLTAINNATNSASGLVTGATFQATAGKKLSVSNTLTLSGTDGSSLAIGAGGTLGSLAFKSTASLTTDVSGILPVANGGTGTSTPSLVAGTNVTITGTWPNQTINATGGGGSMVYPGAGVAVSTGTAWDTSYTTSGTGTQLALTAAPTFTGAQTWNVGTLNATGLSASQTWTGGGTYNAFALTVTDTSSAAASNLMALATGAGNQFTVRKDGILRASFGTVTEPTYSFLSETNTGIFRPSANALGVSVAGVRVATFDQAFGLNLGAYNLSIINGGFIQYGSGGVPDLFVRRAAAATLQLGAADVAAGNAVAQTLRVQSTTAAAQTAPDFTIQGSRGTTAGGSIVFQTAATSTYGDAFKLNPNKTANFYGNIDVSAVNVSTDTTTGTKIGTSATQKLGFWNATPVAQPTTAIGAATVAATGTGNVVAASTTFDGYTIPQIVKALRDAGILQ